MSRGRRRPAGQVLLVVSLLLVAAVAFTGCGRLRNRLNHTPSTQPAVTVASTTAPTGASGSGATTTTVDADLQAKVAALDSGSASLDSQSGELQQQIGQASNTSEPDPAN